MNEYIDDFKKLSINDKREVLVNEVFDVLTTIENLCIKRKIRIEKLKSAYYIKNKEVLFEEDYYDLLFIYVTYIKEDLAILL